MFSADQLKLIENEFAHISSLFFNSAYFGPSPLRSKKLMENAVSRELDPSYYPYQEWISIPDNIRDQIATLLNCSSDSIAHSTSTTDIVSLVANGYDWKEGDIACAINKDFPSDVLPWMVAEKNTPMTFKLLDLGDQEVPSAQWLADHLPSQTKIFNMSFVTFETGKKMNLEEIGKLCRQRDILFLVDATQAIGGMNITQEELKYIDIIACSSYKWMLGPYGHAYAYFSQLAQSKIRRLNATWVNSVNREVNSLLEYTTDHLPGARKYDRGQASNMLNMACLKGALELLNELGLENIQKYNEEMRDYFLSIYPSKKYELITPKKHMANIVCLKAKDHNANLGKRLKDNNVDVSEREGKLRLSFHLFNNKKQIETLAKTLDY
jgi:selenocysteine lyase/cysteine desulfurase